MATATQATRTAPTAPDLVPYRLTVKQFLTMIDANVFDEDQVELLGGILYPMTTNDPHDFTVDRLAEMLRPSLPAGWKLREEKSVQLGRFWRPEPDIAVLRAPSTAFKRRSPQSRDIALLVEVSDTSYAKDSGIKLQQYAHAGVAQYWIVHLERRQVEVYCDPYGRGDRAKYRSVTTYREDMEIPIVLDGQDLGRIAVREILP
jgi:Uma2 family endonuclease